MDSLKLSTKQFGGFLRGTPIKIFVGSEKTVYHVHPDVLSACKSSTASVHINGSWKDVGDGAIDWTDFNEQTIECVLHYLYTGDYDTPVPEPESSVHGSEGVKNGPEQTEDTEEPSATEPSATEPFTAPQSPLTKEVPLRRPLTPLPDCVDAGFPTTQRDTAAGIVAQTDFKSGEHAIGVTIWTHAQIYSFAHRHFFPDLAKLALQRLTQILHLAPCESSTLFPYLGDSIRHVYETTPGPEIQEDPARKLLSHYFALNYTKLAGEDLYTLVEEGGELMIDILNKLVRLLTTKTSQIGSLSAELRELQIICSDKDKEIQQMREIQAQDQWGPTSSSIPKKKKMGSLF